MNGCLCLSRQSGEGILEEKMRQFKEIAQYVCIPLAMLVLFAPRLAGQGLFGTISGSVTDQSGAVVPGATVKVTNVSTNVATTLTTNNAGVYSATSLNPGVYNVQAEAKGFKVATVSGVTLEVGANSKVDLVLQIGATSQVVEVSAAAPLLQVQQSNLGQTVNQRQLDELPTQSGSGRSIFNLLFLTAGVSEQKGGGGGDNDNLRINGDRPRSDDYVLDGTTIEQPVFGGQAFNPAVDSIQEFRVETNSMSAEYGKSSGGVIMAVTKSGTNNFHGSAYEYRRTEGMDARNFFEDPSKPKNPFTYDEFGGTIGGRIIKNKLFFFTDYQGIRQSGSSPSVGNVVPDAAFRSGDLSALCSAGFDASGNCVSAAGQIHFPGTNTPIPFNKITNINSISANLLALFPTSSVAGPSPGTNLASFNSPSTNSLNRFNPRIDYNFSSSDHIFGVFHRQTGQGSIYDLVVGPAGDQVSHTNDYATTIGWTHTFSGNKLNDFRFGYMHRIGDRGGYGQGFTSPSDFGLSGIPNCLSSVPGTSNGTKCGTPGVGINGFNGLATGSTLYEPANVLQFGDTVTWMVGRHTVKMGTEFRHYAIDNYQPNNVTGSFSFNGGQTGNGFADFLLGTMAQGGSVQVQNAFVSSRAWASAFFVQDDYKIKPKLTLNLGLRYQLDNSFHETHKGNAFFNPYTALWEQFGVNAPATTFDRSLKEFGPRLGFAYNPLPGFVVRGGFGIMFPGTVGHGRAGDGQPGPNLLAGTTFNAGTNWSALPPIVSPDPSAITAPIPVNGNVSFSSWAPRKQAPTYTELWNFTLEKQLGSSSAVQLAYVGSHGVHLPINYAYNICQQSRASTLAEGWNATTSPYCSPLAAQEAGIWNLYVTPGWWGLSSSIYHSLQAKFDHRFSHGFSLLANFTWSKLIDDSSSDWGGFWSLDVLGQDFYDRRSERSVSAGDVPLRLTIAPIVELPFGHGKKWAQNGVASQVIGGWRVTGIYTVSDGYPFGITDNSYGYCNAAHVLSDRPNMIGNPLPSGFQQTTQHWFNIAAFDFSGTCPASNLVALTGGGDPTKAFGNSPRYFSNIRVPGVNNIDFSLQKDFRIPKGEQTRLSFRADFYNAVNHPQFASPNSDPTVGNFGSITSTSIANRTIQLGLHLYF
jgi:Carboxypeptidase regulatory-like domain/TonB dependent receptor-like, beta-barrel